MHVFLLDRKRVRRTTLKPTSRLGMHVQRNNMSISRLAMRQVLSPRMIQSGHFHDSFERTQMSSVVTRQVSRLCVRSWQPLHQEDEALFLLIVGDVLSPDNFSRDPYLRAPRADFRADFKL